MKQHELEVNPEVGFDEDNLKGFLTAKNLLREGQYFQINRRSVDARRKRVRVNLAVSIDGKPFKTEFVEYKPSQHLVSDKPEVIIVGAGPAGLFAALKCIELNLKPIVIERGKDVRARRRDLAAINKEHKVNPDSNYCFGEGGAGTYSDGKLYTRSKKRGSIRRIFEILVAHGATEEILFEAHPHIGTNKLPKIVTALRESVIEHGGEILFNTKVSDLIINGDELQGVITSDNQEIRGKGVILATGHSARDIFHLLNRRKVLIEAKAFALGVRIEHPQPLIDQIQYHGDRGQYLPPSAYSISCQTSIKSKQRGMFSFCMCPGGFIVPAATDEGELVVNGMSPSRRDGKYANSGMVVSVELDDIPQFQKYGPLAALEFQSHVEKRAWELAGKTQSAPAQQLVDFLENQVSSSLNQTSYQPGLASVNMSDVLPEFIVKRMKQGFHHFKTKMKGYVTNEAQLIGVESRTSSPIRIPRDKESLEHPRLKGLFPCGEGAGYAGGIVSAAMDGEKCAKAAYDKIYKKWATP